MLQPITRAWLKVAACSLLAALVIAAAFMVYAPQAAANPIEKTSVRPAVASAGASAKQPTDANVSIAYRAKVQKLGWRPEVANDETAGTTGQSLRLLGFRATLGAGTYSGSSVAYRAHLTSGKWTAWKKNGAKLAPSTKVDAFQMKLSGSIANDYDIVYRAHVQNIGWQRRMRNGESAGLAGGNLRIEALRISLVPKNKASGWINSWGSWHYYENGVAAANSWIVTAESPIDLASAGLQRYWIDSTGTLATNRYVVPLQATDSNAKWTAFATPEGYVVRGKYTNSDGIILANNDGKLYTKTRWLTTKRFDGKKQRYRLVKKGAAAVVKTGLFKVKGKKYYGWEDGRGYIMRSKTWYVANGWYKANSKGVLKNYSGKMSKVIDRYVKWAVKIAKNDKHGYSQANRWGPDYDCSSLVCTALKKSGFPDSGASWTGNMKTCLKKIGFVWHSGTSGLRRGDIMLVHASWMQHTEIYIGNGKLVGAHSSETGGIYGQAGDQTGNEISVTSYYNPPWQGYLRYKG